MQSLETHPNVILGQAELIHDEHTVSQALARVANEITLALADESPVVLCVMGGGVVFAGQLLPRLTFPLEFDYVQASRYHNRTDGDALQWKVKPSSIVRDRTVLVLDDILDEGITLAAIKTECLALGAKQVLVAVLVEKALNREKPIHADYIGLEVPNRYVFGCGMDVYGWWRNLPAIYAL